MKTFNDPFEQLVAEVARENEAEMTTRKYPNKKDIDALVKQLRGCTDIHKIRAILFDVFNDGVLLARELMTNHNLRLRKKAFLRAATLFDIAAPEQELEERSCK